MPNDIYVYECKCGEIYPDRGLPEERMLHILTRHKYEPQRSGGVLACQSPISDGKTCGASTMRVMAGQPICSPHAYALEGK